jgi:tRNA G18 (ribose-2'-O)-methylase SpoU
MARQEITSLEDPRLDAFRDLSTTPTTKRGDRFIVEGMWLVERLAASRLDIESVLVGQRREQQASSLVGPETQMLVVDDAMLSQIVGFKFHRGVLACGLRPAGAPLGSILPEDDRPLTLLACVEIKDQENLGAILRTSYALDVDAVLLSRGCADPFSRRTIRVSMGAAFELPVIESLDLQHDLVRLRDEHDISLIATSLSEDSTPLDQCERTNRVALLLGSEGPGLSPQWIDECNMTVRIPMRRGADSLNVAVAAGIVLNHLRPPST